MSSPPPSLPSSQSPLRVAILTESFLPYLSGVTVSVDALSRGLGAQGHRVLLVAPRPADGAPPAATSPGPDPQYAWLPSYELSRLTPPRYRMPTPLPGTALRAIEGFGPHVVHVQSPFVSGLTGRAAARRLRVPLVFTHHTRFGDYRHYLGPLGSIAGGLLDAFVAQFWKGCAAVVAPSEGLAREIARRLPPRTLRPLVRAIPTGIDLAAVDALQGLDPRPRFGWPQDSVVAVSLGRLAAEKNVVTLLEAFATAARNDPRLRLLLIGSGPAEERVRARSSEPDLAGRVALTGLLPRAAALARLRRCDLFVFASLTETQGIVLAEAAACGLPIVALDGPGVRETVTHGRDGIVVEDGAASLGAAVAELAADDTRRTVMGSAARASAERFSLDRCVARVVALYREVAA